MKFNPYTIREDFPTLNRMVHGKPLIYLDNAATTHKPKQVIEAIKDFYEKYNSNVHRGVHTLSQEASSLYEEAHEVTAKFINAYSWEEVIFTKNATDSLNLVAYSWGLKNLKPGDEIVITIMEHHSNMLPWRNLELLKGVKVKYVDINDDGTLKYDELERMVNERTKIIAVTLMSNVLGTINDVKRIVKIAREVNAIVVVDGAQGVPHMPVNVRELGIDFLAFSAHKMLGPTGIGVLWGKKERLEEMMPLKVGGGTIKDVTLDSVEWNDLPWRFEDGTPNIAGSVGLSVAIEYLRKVGMENVRQHEIELTRYTLKRFEELKDALTWYGPQELSMRGGIVSFNIEGLDHHAVGKALDLLGIAVRTGMHCTHPLHYRLGIKGSVRASFYIYNVKEEIDTFVDSLRTITNVANILSLAQIDRDRCTCG